ncbi:unnamed protein product, partial [Phaeothamnion confervicola]
NSGGHGGPAPPVDRDDSTGEGGCPVSTGGDEAASRRGGCDLDRCRYEAAVCLLHLKRPREVLAFTENLLRRGSGKPSACRPVISSASAAAAATATAADACTVNPVPGDSGSSTGG